MSRTTIALLSTAPPSEPGSMGGYGEMVLDALSNHTPQFDPVLVSVCDTRVASGSIARRFARMGMIFSARRRAREVRADVFHVLDGSFAYLIGGIPWERTLVTVHDLIPALQVKGRFPVARPGWGARKLIDSSLSRIRNAGAVHAVSLSTAEDLHTVCGRTADVMLHNALRPLADAGTNKAVGRDDSAPYVLHIGNNSFYKNRCGVMEVFARIAHESPDLRLVLAGPAPDEALRVSTSRSGLEGRVEFVVNPSDAVLASLYRNASVLLFPSLYEGFGWPPLEAMHYGCPVVCSRAASLPEVVGDAALMCDPWDHAGFAAAVLRLLSDPSLVQRQVKRGYLNLKRFDAQVLAAGLGQVYSKLAGASGRERCANLP